MKGRPPVSVKERLMALCEPVTESGCWIWLGALSHNGYGFIGTGEGNKIRRAHRVSYELHIGPIPEGMQLDHLCRVRCCINPWHCEVVTLKENVLRGVGLSAQNARKTHCKNGHPLSMIDRKTRRKCGVCY